MPTKTKAKAKTAKAANLDLDPDAWPKFEALVKDAAKMGPKPHLSPHKSQKRIRSAAAKG